MLYWALLFFIVAGAAAMGAFYFFYRTSTVLVENKSNISVSDIWIQLNGETFWSGALAPGDSHREFGFAKPDDVGSLVISFSSKGIRHEREFPSGFTSWGNNHRLRITPTLDVEHLWMN